MTINFKEAIAARASKQIDSAIADYKQAANPMYVAACKQLKVMCSLLEAASYSNADSIKLIIEVDGKQEAVDLFFADAIGTLDEALKALYEQHFNEMLATDD